MEFFEGNILKPQTFGLLLLIANGMWLTPQLYVGNYLPLFTDSSLLIAIYFLSLCLIVIASIVAVAGLASSLRLKLKSWWPILTLFVAAASFLSLWNWLFMREGQLYKTIWVWEGLLTPLWAIMAVAFLIFSLRRARLSAQTKGR